MLPGLVKTGKKFRDLSADLLAAPSLATLNPGREGRLRPLRVLGGGVSRDSKVD
jgi:hypothetical protein